MPAEEVQNFGHEVALKRPGQPEEIAPAYVYFASDDGSFSTGAILEVTGGKLGLSRSFRGTAEDARATEAEVLTRLHSDEVSERTRRVMLERIAHRPNANVRIFSDSARGCLESLVESILTLGEDERSWRPDVAGEIEERLRTEVGKGWRYDTLPPEREMYSRELERIAELGFLEWDTDRREKFIEADLKHTPFFTELLAETVEIFYSHPFAQSSIGAEGMFDERPSRTGAGSNSTSVPENPAPSAGTSVPKRPDALTLSADPQRPIDDRGRLPHVIHHYWDSMRHYSLDETVDAVVIGTGAGGAPLLARLAAAGLRVVAIEAGPRFDPYAHYAADERSQSALFWRDERLSAGRDALAFGNNNSGTGVGGSTLHYTAYVPRPQPDDFRLGENSDRARSWPIEFSDLLPYIESVEELLGVSGPATYPWGPARSKAYPLPPLNLNEPAKRMRDACETLGIRTSPAANAALSAPYYREGLGWRPACTERGYCQVGCARGGKASMDVTYIPLAVSQGADVRDRSFVTGVTRDSVSGCITGVDYIHGGKAHHQRTAHVFLAAGGIESARFLLMHGLANSSGQVGRNFMAHPGLQVWGKFPERIDPSRGIPGALISEDFHRASNGEFEGGYLLQSIGVMPVTYASQLARGERLHGQKLREHLREYPYVAGINMLGDCLPSPENFLELSDERDARGLPKPRIHFSNGENERRMIAHADEAMTRIWQTAGARDLWKYSRSAHIIGTCRMGEDPSDSVVDRDGRSHDIPNLTISDNSIFPSALSVNPSLTIMALSLKIADAFLAERARA